MSRIRLSRAESREQTRRRLIAAATTIIAKKGLAATSVENIAAKAGFTRGAFYSNFSSKADLFVELLRVEHRLTQENLRNLVDTSESSESLQTQLVSLCEQCYRDSSNYILWAEAHLHAMRDTKFRQRLNALTLEKRDVITCFITQFCERINIQLPMDPNVLALTMMTLIDGVLYLNMSMPNDIRDEAIRAALGMLFKSTFLDNDDTTINETS
ncbi:TetR/AcrR family transcriptional regulator [Dyella acidisoli]|uniref:TetR family transcriptional regulator n=1 Tax=Dyella acidisoli TaxID=1867834 RepID=A0ABQ5XJU3_9GAMM|nr:TetR/AcrR family transcriptional regulator [Dyella acidisoli]GLQ91979.1 TetR family transcriptional regulator [Dyella acidisoli]